MSDESFRQKLSAFSKDIYMCQLTSERTLYSERMYFEKWSILEQHPVKNSFNVVHQINLFCSQKEEGTWPKNALSIRKLSQQYNIHNNQVILGHQTIIRDLFSRSLLLVQWVHWDNDQAKKLTTSSQEMTILWQVICKEKSIYKKSSPGKIICFKVRWTSMSYNFG